MVQGSLWLLSALALMAGGCGENETPPPEKDPYQPPTIAPLSCIPNLDNRIDAVELQASYDVPQSLLVNPAGEERAVDTVGEKVEGGFVLNWDADFASDRSARISAQALGDQWFASSFPEGQFVTPNDLGGRILGVYQQTEQAFLLWGLASAEQDPPEGRTLFVYETPIELYRFPIQPGGSWISKGQYSNGVVQGLQIASQDTYETTVEGPYEVRLPDLIFQQAMRVSTRVTLQPVIGASIITRQVSFLTECFGEVARATSKPGETNDAFTVAAEVRRLGF
ncbi:MAG: hypothetical protein EOO74_08845 [Myxococcales bacterium]|nr:MAG: hypothetical protein EOO74_08845 [Myxococcales bacterium]